MEAEKFLTETDSTVDNPLETDSEVKKGKTNGDAPEYRSNPLL